MPIIAPVMLSVCHASLGLLEMRLVLDFVLPEIIKLIDTEHLVQIGCYKLCVCLCVFLTK